MATSGWRTEHHLASLQNKLKLWEKTDIYDQSTVVPRELDSICATTNSSSPWTPIAEGNLSKRPLARFYVINNEYITLEPFEIFLYHLHQSLSPYVRNLSEHTNPKNHILVVWKCGMSNKMLKTAIFHRFQSFMLISGTTNVRRTYSIPIKSVDKMTEKFPGVRVLILISRWFHFLGVHCILILETFFLSIWKEKKCF